MAAVRRALLRWLMFSPRRLLTLALAASVAVVVAVQLPALLDPPPTPDPVAAPSSPTTAPRPAPPAPRTTNPRPGPTTTPSTPTSPTSESSTPSSGPREQARRFAQAWVNTAGGKRAWLARLRSLCTEEYAAVVLPQIELANIPADRLTGGLRVVHATGRLALVEVDLNNDVTIAVELVDTTGAGAWRVTAVSDASTGTI